MVRIDFVDLSVLDEYGLVLTFILTFAHEFELYCDPETIPLFIFDLDSFNTLFALNDRLLGLDYAGVILESLHLINFIEFSKLFTVVFDLFMVLNFVKLFDEI